MNKELEEKLRNIQANPTTGSAHNKQIIFTQVEEIFALDKATKEINALGNNFANYSKNAKKETHAMRYLTIALAVVAALQLFIVYGQFKLAETQIETSQDQATIQNAIWEYEKIRNDRLEERDVDWRREDLQFQGRLP